MDIDSSGNGGSGSKGEHKVQKVKDGQDDGPGKGRNEVGQDPVDGGGQEAKGGGKHGEIDLGVRLKVGGTGKGAGQPKGNDEEDKVEQT